VEYHYGHDDAVKYLNGYKPKILNRQPIIAPRGVNASPPADQYFKAALMINTLRSVIDDDVRWWKLLHDFYQHFKYQNIMTEDVVEYFSHETGKNLTPIFNQYLRHMAIPTLELKFDEPVQKVGYRWNVDEPDFAMPVRVGKKGQWQLIMPTNDWQTLEYPLSKDEFDVATDLYYISVHKL
jgi:aminopeptidase N